MTGMNLNPNISQEENASEAPDEIVFELSQKLIEKNKEAYEKLSE